MASGLAAQNVTGKILQTHMTADQAHDALRADALTAVLAATGDAGESLDAVRDDIKDHAATFRKAIQQNSADATDPAIRDALKALDQPLTEYIASVEKIVNLAGQDRALAVAALPEFQRQFKVLEVAMEKASGVIEARDTAADTSATSHAAIGRMIMMGMVAVALLFSVALIVLSSRMLIQPIRELARDMNLLARGQTDISLRGANRKDEVGDIGRAVREFQAVISDRARQEAEAAEAQRRREMENELAASAADAQRARAQAEVVQALGSSLDRLANGDLAFRLESAFPAEYEGLRVDFNRAVSRLEDTMRSLIHAVEGVHSGASEINKASDDLSRRTEQQAASLEQTAAALDQITATVRKTASGAAEATSTVRTTRSEAQASEGVMREAVEAMDAINESSRQISQIIGVIDEIAFQTNLLALNAGVEAARAGEAGRGFAVVATEVRALAQRSADAAKEIKDLISASGAQVERGVDLVGRTGVALEKIRDGVSRVAAVTEEIAASAKEQALGLDEVNRAVNQMDQVTQQNAAMVEETTAASHSMRQEADNLNQLVGAFQISRDGNRGGAWRAA
jgi:methyl-accepting chemotaxis protein